MRDDFDPERTVYMCPGACPDPVLIVSRCLNEPEEGTGYRFGEWMVRNPFDVVAFSRSGTGWNKLMKSPRALD
jgi:hypothetical protein